MKHFIMGIHVLRWSPVLAINLMILFFCKHAPSIFFNTPANTFFTKYSVDTMIVVGCMTSGCIRASVIDSFSTGYKTIVPEDCVGDADDRPHQDNLRDIGRRYADVLNSSDVIEYLEDYRGRNY